MPVTNDLVLYAEEIWRTCRPWANQENCIKELKKGYGWHELNVHSFWGTEAAMPWVGMVCYKLVHRLNRRVLQTAEAGVARLKTLRRKVLAIPAIYGRGGRRPTLRLGVQDGRLRAQIRYSLGRIQRLGFRLLNGNAVGLPPSVQA